MDPRVSKIRLYFSISSRRVSNSRFSLVISSETMANSSSFSFCSFLYFVRSWKPQRITSHDIDRYWPLPGLVRDVEQRFVRYDRDHVDDCHHPWDGKGMDCSAEDYWRFRTTFSPPIGANETFERVDSSIVDPTASFFVRSSSAFFRSSGICRSESCSSKWKQRHSFPAINGRSKKRTLERLLEFIWRCVPIFDGLFKIVLTLVITITELERRERERQVHA